MYEIGQRVDATGSATCISATARTDGPEPLLGDDADGARTGQSDSVSGASSSYGYDQDDRLITVTTGLTQSSYAYDEDGLRPSKSLDGALSRG